ncbi:hypothetical protein C1E24_14035 [Pseudoalteromonas phenolica]|uniref:Uncharacterized protein n=2 Tax=Pseudoalteromonas phenolica TaxID=161398 RepID=A0A5R9Q003_9GAMM|nr:hypothetical protein C1E24_14035 [Pseudoalteromonas phenolica]
MRNYLNRIKFDVVVVLMLSAVVYLLFEIEYADIEVNRIDLSHATLHCSEADKLNRVNGYIKFQGLQLRLRGSFARCSDFENEFQDKIIEVEYLKDDGLITELKMNDEVYYSRSILLSSFISLFISVIVWIYCRSFIFGLIKLVGKRKW